MGGNEQLRIEWQKQNYNNGSIEPSLLIAEIESFADVGLHPHDTIQFTSRTKDGERHFADESNGETEDTEVSNEVVREFMKTEEHPKHQ